MGVICITFVSYVVITFQKVSLMLAGSLPIEVLENEETQFGATQQRAMSCSMGAGKATASCPTVRPSIRPSVCIVQTYSIRPNFRKLQIWYFNEVLSRDDYFLNAKKGGGGILHNNLRAFINSRHD
jgi:hypothetical protein